MTERRLVRDKNTYCGDVIPDFWHLLTHAVWYG